MNATASEIAKIMAKQIATVNETAKVVRIGRGQAYRAVNDGTIRSVRIGKKIMVPTSAIREFLEGKTNPAA
jgi:excisionase family DNA binding protein